MEIFIVATVLSLLCLLPAGCFCEFHDYEAALDLAKILVGLHWSTGTHILHPLARAIGGLENGTATRFNLLMKAAGEKGVYLKLKALDDMVQVDSDSPVVYWSEEKGDVEDFLWVLKGGSYPHEGLLLAALYDIDDDIEALLNGASISRAFFFHQLGSGELHRIQTFRSGEVLVRNEWPMKSDGAIIPVYNFHGAPLSIICTLNDFPWLQADPCDEQSDRACSFRGSDVDMLKVFKNMFNFSLEVHIQLDGDWGIVRSSG